MFGKEKAQKQPETLGEFIRSILIAILFAMGIQTVAYQTFNIPSGSMKPNLLIGDFIFVSKFAYGYTHYSIPFSPPLFEGRLFGSEPKRGEVVVFRAPHKTNSEDWIKRCIGLPGDKIQMRGGVLFINDQECPLEKLDGDFLDTLYIKYNGDGTEERILDKNGPSIERYMQTLPNGVKHIIIKEKPFGLARLDNTPELVVPAGHYFMMGDNRDGSDDSRNQQALGFVPYENLIGRAELIFFSTEARWWEFWNWLTGIRFNRLLNVIR
ncbi:signal peptidase I [Caedimonas varicaedens]|jgi:signal peptidase I|uniref:Signal peptidase I n=1 Tax=Caedimonas varicaedens TaxID=1629334 RepID=A0A0K8MDR4_9PROT|nr:signal peptidase I [Caedimonas varicaedens]